jgi:hypothetical protein
MASPGMSGSPNEQTFGHSDTQGQEGQSTTNRTHIFFIAFIIDA